MRYAKKYGLEEYESYGPEESRLDVCQTWSSVCREFRETTGIRLDLKEVVGYRNLIIAFFSNWEVESITDEKLDPCLWLTQQPEMGFGEDACPRWYLDRDNYVSADESV